MELHEELLFLNEEDVLSLLTPADAIAAAEDTFLHIGLGKITVGEMALMYADQEKKNNFHSMPAILHHKHMAGVKWIDTYANPLPGYPFSHGNLVLLSDTRTGSPIAVVGATNITTMRTPGATASCRQSTCATQTGYSHGDWLRCAGESRHTGVFDTVSIFEANPVV